MKIKKTAALLTALCFIFAGMTACGGESNNIPPTDNTPVDNRPPANNNPPVNNTPADNPPQSDIPENPTSDFEYRYDADLRGVEIIKYIGNSIKVRIPGKIEGEPVVSIGGGAFSESGIMEVYIPDSVTSIGGAAFRWCAGLTNVTIPNSVTNIDRSAFFGCSNLINAVYKGISYSVETERERIEAEIERQRQWQEENPNSEPSLPRDTRDANFDDINLPQEFYDAINGE